MRRYYYLGYLHCIIALPLVAVIGTTDYWWIHLLIFTAATGILTTPPQMVLRKLYRDNMLTKEGEKFAKEIL